MPRKPAPPMESCPYCGYATTLHVAVMARHSKASVLRAMWCAGCRGTFLSLRRLLPEVTAIDSRRLRAPARLDVDKLKRGLTLSVRKVPGDGFRDPANGDAIPKELLAFAADYALGFLVDRLAIAASEPNGAVTTDQIAAIAMAGLNRMHGLAFLRYAVSHRMFKLESTPPECEGLAEAVQVLVDQAYRHTTGYQAGLPKHREVAPPLLCPRCGLQNVARRSRATVSDGFGQQPSECGRCGQRYVIEWGAQVPLLVTSRRGASPFEPNRFRRGIATSVRDLPAAAAIWGDDMVVASAASSALRAATGYIRPASSDIPTPTIDGGDLWLAAAAGLRGIHPLAFARYAVHSGAIDDLDPEDTEIAGAMRKMEGIVKDIGQRYFGSRRFPEIGI